MYRCVVSVLIFTSPRSAGFKRIELPNMNPLSNLLPEEEMLEIPRPQIHASREEWEKIAGEMYRRGLQVKTVGAPVLVRRGSS